MARKSKGVPEIPSASTADIAFMLLIFFLVATTMDVDSGISRKLPPWDPNPVENTEIKIKERNVFVVLINSKNQLLVENQWLNVKKLKEKAKEFIVNKNDDPNLPEKEMQNVPFFGNYPISKQVISLQNDRGTSYGMYIQVTNELVAAYNELREDLAQQKFGKTFDKLTEEQRDAITTIYPQRISEAEPKNVGGN